MKKISSVTIISLIFFITIWVIGACTLENRGTITQYGKITTIDPNLHRIYVRVPLGYRQYLVMGQVDADTLFVKDGHAAQLSDFSEGQTVVVQWKETGNGQLIVAIQQHITELGYF